MYETLTPVRFEPGCIADGARGYVGAAIVAAEWLRDTLDDGIAHNLGTDWARKAIDLMGEDIAYTTTDENVAALDQWIDSAIELLSYVRPDDVYVTWDEGDFVALEVQD